MDDGVMSAVAEVLDRLNKLANEDARLRVRLQQIGRAFLQMGENGNQNGNHDTHSDRESASLTLESTPCRDLLPPSSAHTHSEPSLNGNGFVNSDAVRTRTEFGDEVDLVALEQRCRLKAEAARYAADRRKLQAIRGTQREDADPRLQELISKAKSLPDCFLWMCHADGPEPVNGASYEDVAGCFDATADAVALNRAAMESPEVNRAAKEKALYLLAEAQSALRSSVSRFDGYADPDQTRAFRWLRSKAADTQIYIRRYMRAGDPADPAKWPDLAARIEGLDIEVQDASRKTRLRRKLVGRVRHKASLIAELPANDARETWRELSLIVDELITLGLSPTDGDLREFLSPIHDRAPDLDSFPFPAGFKLVIREVLRFSRALQPSANGQLIPDPAPMQPNGENTEWLRGRAAVLIGGACRPGDHQSLLEALGLADLFWIETHEPIGLARFEPYVAREEVALVLITPEWTGDPDGAIRDFCRRHGKPLVRLEDGYEPERVIAQILEQCAVQV